MDGQTQKENVIIKLFIREIIHYWYLFLISIVFFLGIGLFLYKYSPPAYEVGLDLMINSTRHYNRNMQPDDFLQGFQLLEQSKEIDNEMVVIQSLPLIEKTLKDLNFKVAYYYKENYLPFRYWPFYNYPNLFLREMYQNIPFEVVPDENHPQPVGTFFYIKILNDKEFSVSLHAKDVFVYDYQKDITLGEIDELNISKTAKFGEVIEGPGYSFRVFLNSKYNDEFDNKDLYFSFQDIFWLTRGYQSNLHVRRSSLESSIVSISLKGYNVQKSIDFLNKLADNYIQKGLSKKVYIAEMTIDYIDKELSNISTSLSQAEGQLQSFKKRHQVMDLDQKTQRLSQNIQAMEDQKNSIEQNLRFYEELYKYFEENKDSSNILAPSSMGVEDPVLNTMIQQLATFNAQKNMMEEKHLQRNPRYKTVIAQINDLKNSILENIQFYIRSTRAQLKEINTNINRYSFQESMLPRTQTQLLGYERKFNLNNDIYNFLLQKRAEAQIAKASIVPDSEIVEPATYLGTSSSKKMLMLGFMLFMAFLLPGGFIILRIYFNNKITNPEDIKILSNLPLLGKVLHNNKKSNNVLVDFPLSPISESIRKLRTNLDFYIQDQRHQVILVTSADTNEGKSFVSINLAISLALLNKKIILLGFDLRKPSKLYESLGIDTDIGLSSYLTGKNKLSDILFNTDIPNLDIIPAGSQHPEPSELLTSTNLKSFFDKLKNNYDFIVIDTPPVGLVSDTFQLMKTSDINLFIVRQNITARDALRESLSEIANNNIKNVCIVLNDLDPKSSGYGYQKGYKKYYIKEEKKNRKRFFSNRKT